MLAGYVILGGIVLALTVVVMRCQPAAMPAVLREALSEAATVVPRMAFAIVLAGFLANLLPSDGIAAHLGPESGWLGLVLAAVAGAVTPGGPMMAFPIAVAFERFGVGFAHLVAYIAGWSVLGLMRVLVFELPILGGRLTALRWLSSLALPLLAGLAAGLLASR